MSLESFVTYAENEIGYHEESDGTTKFGDWYGISKGSWCAMFIAWCANKAGILTTADSAEPPHVPKESTVTNMKSFYVNNRRNLTPKMDPASNNYPKRGDIVTIQNAGSSGEGHIGIVKEVIGNKVITIEGNASDEVKSFTYTDLEASFGARIVSLLSNHVSY